LNPLDHEHKHIPEIFAFTLNNRIRRRLQPPEQLISKLGIRPSDVVLDFGCGPGFFTVPLARVAARVVAVDVSPEMLEKAASYAKSEGVVVEFLRSDGIKIKLENESVDVVFLNHVFHEIDDGQKALSEFLRTMKPSGRLIIVERSRGSRLLGGKLGPPIINPTEVVREIERAGFIHARTIAHGNDSIIVGQKK
jgi:ubiquinone/menaquinone biosynthesis C-methylase UbiE